MASIINHPRQKVEKRRTSKANSHSVPLSHTKGATNSALQPLPRLIPEMTPGYVCGYTPVSSLFPREIRTGKIPPASFRPDTIRLFRTAVPGVSLRPLLALSRNKQKTGQCFVELPCWIIPAFHPDGPFLFTTDIAGWSLFADHTADPESGCLSATSRGCPLQKTVQSLLVQTDLLPLYIPVHSSRYANRRHASILYSDRQTYILTSL